MKFNKQSDAYVSDCGRYTITATKFVSNRTFYACRVDGVVFRAGLTTLDEAVQHCLRRKNA